MIYKDFTDCDTDVYDIDAINNSIRNILLTKRGSVPGKPLFGSDIETPLFNQMDHITESLIQKGVISALNEFEPRIIILDVEIKAIPEYNKYVINVTYEYRDKGLIKSSSTNVSFNI